MMIDEEANCQNKSGYNYEDYYDDEDYYDEEASDDPDQVAFVDDKGHFFCNQEVCDQIDESFAEENEEYNQKVIDYRQARTALANARIARGFYPVVVPASDKLSLRDLSKGISRSIEAAAEAVEEAKAEAKEGTRVRPQFHHLLDLIRPDAQ